MFSLPESKEWMLVYSHDGGCRRTWIDRQRVDQGLMIRAHSLRTEKAIIFCCRWWLFWKLWLRKSWKRPIHEWT